MEPQHRTDVSRIDLRALEKDLRAAMRGEVLFSDGDRTLYATDGSNYRQVPIGVVRPRDGDDVVAGTAVCRKHGAPVLGRGAGTSLAGQCCNVAVVFDYSKHMNRILEVDAEKQIARVQPGVILDHLRAEAEKYHLTFAPDPATHNHNTLGGMIGNNSCGIHSVMGGRTADNIVELEVLTYDGLRMRVGETSAEELEAIITQGGRRSEIYRDLKDLRDRYAPLIKERYPAIPRRVSGFNLDELLPDRNFQVARALVGSEGTCVAVLEAVVRLVPSPPHRVLLVLGYPSVYHAADHVTEIMKYGPVGLEGLDDRLISDMKRANLHPEDANFLPDGAGWLLVEMGAYTKEEATRKAEHVMARLRVSREPPAMKLYVPVEEQEQVWAIRESGLGATAHVPGKPITWPGWEDSAVPPDRAGEYLRKLRALFERYGYGCDLYGHFGQGCIHTRVDFDLMSAKGIESYKSFVKEAADLVVSFGGSLSGEHGDGQSRGQLLTRMYGEELVNAFCQFKQIWDPEWKMNPGKVVDPWLIDQNLRLGTTYDPPTWKKEWQTVFEYPRDNGDFSRALLRCVGVGKCRREEQGTMCPSYMVLREEKHTTRGRAHLLYEMLNGDVLKHGWKEEAVRESLDLCLSCKGCRGECPVKVDIPTYKAEFLHHYYKGKLRPRTAYAFGYVDIWSRLGSLAPNLVNNLLTLPGMQAITKRLAGIAEQRTIPPLANTTLQRAMRDWPPVAGDRPEVLLWPDTFNNFYYPDTGLAAVQALEAAGFRVRVPQGALCCGRPLYEFGLLDRAKRLLVRTLDVLQEEIRAGMPVIVLEPACASVFRDELVELMPRNKQASRLRDQTSLFSEFLRQHAPNFAPPLERKALVHFHCHHKSTMKTQPDTELLKAMGVEAEVLSTGCCGMAGSFGFDKKKYDVSMGAGERVLLPAVRKAPDETLIIADGYSCREQIWQGAQRESLHPADVLSLALREERVAKRWAEIGSRLREKQLMKETVK